MLSYLTLGTNDLTRAATEDLRALNKRLAEGRLKALQ